MPLISIIGALLLMRTGYCFIAVLSYLALIVSRSMFYIMENGKHEIDDVPMGIRLFNARDDDSPMRMILLNVVFNRRSRHVAANPRQRCCGLRSLASSELMEEAAPI